MKYVRWFKNKLDNSSILLGQGKSRYLNISIKILHNRIGIRIIDDKNPRRPLNAYVDIYKFFHYSWLANNKVGWRTHDTNEHVIFNTNYESDGFAYFNWRGILPKESEHDFLSMEMYINIGNVEGKDSGKWFKCVFRAGFMTSSEDMWFDSRDNMTFNRLAPADEAY